MFKKMKWQILLAIVWIVAMLAFPYLSNGLAAKEKPTVKIGLTTFTEGGALKDGRAYTRAFKTAISYINNRGGILGGRRVEGFVASQGMTGDTARAAALKLAMRYKVKALIGPHWASTVAGGLAVAKRFNLPYSPDYGAWWLHRQDYPGTLCLSSNGGARMFGQMRWMEKKGYKTVVFLLGDITYAHDVEKFIQDRWGKPGSPKPGSPVKVLDIIWYPFGQTELSKELTKAVGYNPDFIWSEDWSAHTAVAVMKSLHEIGYKGDYSVTSVLTNHIIAKVPKEISEGCYSHMDFCPDPNVPENKAFCDYWQKEWGEGELPYRAEESIWSQAVFLLLSMDKAGTEGDGTKEGLMKIHDAMHSLKWIGPRGEPMNLHGGRGLWSRTPMVKIIDGELNVVEYLPLTSEDWLYGY